LTLVSAQARAFSYPEHFVITRHAIVAVEHSDPGARPMIADVGVYFAGTSMSHAMPTDDSPSLEAGKFDLADLPALAGDHAVTPHHLMRRWFWGPSTTRSCQWRNLGDALADIDAYSEAPSVCADRPENEPCNREALLATVRRYHDGSATVRSTDDIDASLASADCAYVCLATRGTSHFRLPEVPVHVAASLAGTPNAAFTYAKWHAVALSLAALSHDHPDAHPSWGTPPDPRARYRAAALVYELFALHFLQDGVAAGHIVTPRGYGNMTTLATHDHHNRVGISIVVPEAVCDHPGAARFPKLVRRCRPGAGNLARVRGDHAISDGIVQDPDDVTEELAQLLSEVSLEEVVQEGTERSPVYDGGSAPKPAVPPDLREEVEATLAAFERRTEADCAADWDCPESESRITALIQSAFSRPHRMEALSMWPVAALPARPPIERPGGHNLYFRFATDVSPGLRGSVGAGYAFMASKQSTRLVLAADLLVAYGSSLAGGVHGAAMVHWAEIGGFSFVNELGLTLEASMRAARFDVYACPISYEISSDRMSLHTGLLGGLSMATSADVGRWFVGLGVAATLHLDRKAPGPLSGMERRRRSDRSAARPTPPRIE
jgi:hypothetical protein